MSGGEEEEEEEEEAEEKKQKLTLVHHSTRPVSACVCLQKQYKKNSKKKGRSRK